MVFLKKCPHADINRCQNFVPCKFSLDIKSEMKCSLGNKESCLLIFSVIYFYSDFYQPFSTMKPKVWAIYIAFPVLLLTCIVKKIKKESLLLKAKGKRKRELS